MPGYKDEEKIMHLMLNAKIDVKSLAYIVCT